MTHTDIPRHDPATGQATALPPPEPEHALLSALAPAIVSSALDCIVVIDDAGLVVEFNPAAERTFGYSRSLVVGKPIAELIIPPHLRDRHHQGMAHYLATGKASVLGRRVEIEAMRADGSTLTVELAITEVPLPDRRFFTAHIRDLTEVLKAQAEINHQREAIYQSEKLSAFGSLLAGVAHELNNPLSIVVGQAMMMREACASPTLTSDDINGLAERSAKIEAAADRCAKIVRTFLAMARQRSGEKRPVDLSAMLQSSVDLLAFVLRTAGVQIAVQVQSDLPEIWGDADQLHQVMVNLIVNAAQTLEDVAGERRIVLSARLDGESDQVVLTVADTGPGVPAEIRNRIFDPFFTTKPQGVGTGIGLAVSRGLIEAHGGTLLLAASQRGAAFEVRLPIGRRTDEAEAANEEQPTPPQRPATLRRALIVDDEEELAAVLSELVSRHDFECDLAFSGNEAMRKIQADPSYDVVLCDIRMPDGDGPALHAWLEREAPHLAERIGFITGDTLGPAAHRFLQRTGRPVVEKPFGREEIARIVSLLSGDADTTTR